MISLFQSVGRKSQPNGLGTLPLWSPSPLLSSLVVDGFVRVFLTVAMSDCCTSYMSLNILTVRCKIQTWLSLLLCISETAAKKSDSAAKESAAVGKAKDKAQRAKKAVLRGRHDKRSRKIRTSVHFRRPKTLSLPRAPRYPRKSAPRLNRSGSDHQVVCLPI